MEWLNRAYGVGERILLVGSGTSVQALTRELRGRPDLPINLLGIVEEEGASMASLFTTMMHTSALGALLTLAPTPWYAHYAQASIFGLSALEDQQLGGLLMWVPGGIAYLVAGLAIVAAWLGPAARHELK